MTGAALPGQNRSSLKTRWQQISRKVPRGWAFALAGASLLALLAVLYFGTQKHVEVRVDGRVVSLRTHAGTVAAALAQAGVQLAPQDVATPGLPESLSRQAVIEVRRAVPLTLNVEGQTRSLQTAAATVGEALQGAGVTLDENTAVSPELATAVTAGLEVTIKRLTRVTQVVSEAIPFETVRREDGSLELGQERVVQAGQSGTRQVTVRKTLEDGREVKSEVLEAKVIKPPQARIVAYGTVGQISRGGQVIRFRKALTLTATGYTAGTESNPWATGYTYTGVKATRGVVAVDPRVIPLHTRLYIEGYGFAVAEDIGGAIKGSRIDLCFDTVKEADDYGLRRGIKVYILE